MGYYACMRKRAAALVSSVIASVLGCWIMWEAVVRPLRIMAGWNSNFPSPFYIFNAPIWFWHDFAIFLIILSTLVLGYLAAERESTLEKELSKIKNIITRLNEEFEVAWRLSSPSKVLKDAEENEIYIYKPNISNNAQLELVDSGNEETYLILRPKAKYRNISRQNEEYETG